MFDRFSFSDVINYIVVGAVFCVCLMVIYPCMWDVVREESVGIVEGLFGISLLYVLGFLMMIANDFLDAISKRNDGTDHSAAMWAEWFFGMHFLPGARHYKEAADACDDKGVEIVKRSLGGSLPPEHLKVAYWQFARSQACASVYIHRLRVLHVFAANLSTAFGICSIVSLASLYYINCSYVIQDWFWLVCAFLCYVFRFGRDRLISDRNHAMFESACYGVLSNK